MGTAPEWVRGGRICQKQKISQNTIRGVLVALHFAGRTRSRAADDVDECHTRLRRESDPGVAAQPDLPFVAVHDHLHAPFRLSALAKYLPSRLSPPGRRCTHPPRLWLTRLETRTLVFDGKQREILPVHQTVRLRPSARLIFSLTCAPKKESRQPSTSFSFHTEISLMPVYFRTRSVDGVSGHRVTAPSPSKPRRVSPSQRTWKG